MAQFDVRGDYPNLNRLIQQKSRNFGRRFGAGKNFDPTAGFRAPISFRRNVTRPDAVDSRYVETYRQQLISDEGMRLRLGIPRNVAENPRLFNQWVKEGSIEVEGMEEPSGPSFAPSTTGPGGPSQAPDYKSPLDVYDGSEEEATEPPPPPPSENPYIQRANDYDYVITIIKQLDNEHRALGGGTSEITEELAEEIAYLLEKYGYSLELNPVGYQVVLPLAPDGAMLAVGLMDGIAWLQGESERLRSQADILADLTESEEILWDVWEKWEEGNLDIEPFEDQDGWDDAMATIFGELGAMPDITTFFQEIFELMPMTNYTAAKMPGLDRPHRFAKWLQDLKESGWTADMLEPGKDQEFRDWLYDQAMTLHPDQLFDFDRGMYDNMTATEVAELMKMINYESSGILSKGELSSLVNDYMAPIIRGRNKELRRKLSKFAGRGRGYSSVIMRTTAEMEADLGAAEMSTTADILMTSLQMAEEGKRQAITHLAQLSQTEMDAALQIAGLKGTLAGHYLTFLSQIGAVSASEYATKAEAHVAMAGLQLKAELGIAGLDLEQYMHEGRLDLEALRLYTENYWQEQGINFEMKRQAFNDAIMKYQTAADIATMLQAGDTNRLTMMMSLALQAQQGNREAWKAFNEMRVEYYALERGMDMEQAGMISDLIWRTAQTQAAFDFQKWAIQNEAALRLQLTQAGIDSVAALQAATEVDKGGFWDTLLKYGSAAAVIVEYFF